MCTGWQSVKQKVSFYVALQPCHRKNSFENVELINVDLSFTVAVTVNILVLLPVLHEDCLNIWTRTKEFLYFAVILLWYCYSCSYCSFTHLAGQVFALHMWSAHVTRRLQCWLSGLKFVFISHSRQIPVKVIPLQVYRGPGVWGS